MFLVDLFSSNSCHLSFKTMLLYLPVKLAININPLPLLPPYLVSIKLLSLLSSHLQVSKCLHLHIFHLSILPPKVYHLFFLMLSSMTTTLLPSVHSPIIHTQIKTMQPHSLSILSSDLFFLACTPETMTFLHDVSYQSFLPSLHNQHPHLATPPFSSFHLSFHHKQSSLSNYTIPFIWLFLLLCFHSLPNHFHLSPFGFQQLHLLHKQHTLSLPILSSDICTRIIIISHHNLSAITLITQDIHLQHQLPIPFSTTLPFQPHHHMHHHHLLSFFQISFFTYHNHLAFYSHYKHHAFPSNNSISL